MASNVYSSITALRQTFKRVRRARALFAVGQGIVAEVRSPFGAKRAGRLWRKALRTLDGDTRASPPRPRDAAEENQDPTALRRAVQRRLADYEIAACVRRWVNPRRRVVVVSTLGMMVIFGILVATIPGIRHLFFPLDRALGKPWTATSAFEGYRAKGRIANDESSPVMFHTAAESSPAFTVDLQAAIPISRVTVGNRPNCCQDRAVPLAVEISVDGHAWTRVGYRRMEFRSWTTTFSRTRARFVRLRVDRPSILHLQTVSVY